MYLCGDTVTAQELWEEIESGTYTVDEACRKLGIKCPMCDEALRLRPERVRRITSKDGTTKDVWDRPHFAHYKSTPETWECDRRAISKEGKERLKAIEQFNRNQRLDLYNQHLWEMISVDHNIHRHMLVSIRKTFGNGWCDGTAIIVRKSWAKNLNPIHRIIAATILEIKGAASLLDTPTARPMLEAEVKKRAKNLDAYTSDDFAETLIEEAEKQTQYFAGISLRKHQAICTEVVDFLATRTAGYAFEKIFVAALQQATITLSRTEGLQGKELVEAVKALRPETFFAAIAGLIVGTHWIDQINKHLGNSRKSALSGVKAQQKQPQKYHERFSKESRRHPNYVQR